MSTVPESGDYPAGADVLYPELQNNEGGKVL